MLTFNLFVSSDTTVTAVTMTESAPALPLSRQLPSPVSFVCFVSPLPPLFVLSFDTTVTAVTMTESAPALPPSMQAAADAHIEPDEPAFEAEEFPADDAAQRLAQLAEDIDRIDDRIVEKSTKSKSAQARKVVHSPALPIDHTPCSLPTLLLHPRKYLAASITSHGHSTVFPIATH